MDYLTVWLVFSLLPHSVTGSFRFAQFTLQQSQDVQEKTCTSSTVACAITCTLITKCVSFNVGGEKSWIVDSQTSKYHISGTLNQPLNIKKKGFRRKQPKTNHTCHQIPHLQNGVWKIWKTSSETHIAIPFCKKDHGFFSQPRRLKCYLKNGTWPEVEGTCHRCVWTELKRTRAAKLDLQLPCKFEKIASVTIKGTFARPLSLSLQSSNMRKYNIYFIFRQNGAKTLLTTKIYQNISTEEGMSSSLSRKFFTLLIERSRDDLTYKFDDFRGYLKVKVKSLVDLLDTIIFYKETVVNEVSIFPEMKSRRGRRRH